MTEATIFEGATTPNVTPITQSIVPTEAADFVGEGKKYSSVEDALKSVPHAQKHIQTLEQEMAQLKEELNQRRTTEELLEEIKSGIPKGDTTPKAEFNPDTVAKIAEGVIKQHEQKRIGDANVNKVVGVFREKFAENAEAIYNKVATDAGLPIAVLNQLAATSPEAVLRLAGITTKEESIPAKTTSSFNTQALPKSSNADTISARVTGRGTKDVVDAWRRAGQKIQQT